MKILVCVKQVPDTSGKVAVNPDGTLNRASMQTIINPDDMNAVEAALKLKDELGCTVTVVTMGPPPAEGMLRELMAMGADDGYLVSAREFGGSDTYATSQILAAAIISAPVFLKNPFFIETSQKFKFVFYPFTLPRATPCTICLERIRYTTITGKIEKVIMTYTCPISNFSQSAARNCAIRIGSVFFLSSCKINAGVK